MSWSLWGLLDHFSLRILALFTTQRLAAFVSGWVGASIGIIVGGREQVFVVLMSDRQSQVDYDCKQN